MGNPAMTSSLLISEEFVSIQGEGSRIGVPSYFIRTTGCPLRCAWCDEPSTSWAPKGERKTVAAIVEHVAAAGLRHVVLTGGEPFAQLASVDLAHQLAAGGYHVTIETSGAIERPGLVCDLLSVSPKLAHSTPKRRGENLAARHDQLRHNPSLLRALLAGAPEWQLKFVVRPTCIETDLAEIETLLAEVVVTHPAERARVFLTPEGVDLAVLDAGLRLLAPHCLARGFRLGHRLHLALYGNTPGT